MTKQLHIHRVPAGSVSQAIRVPECADLLAEGLRAAHESDMRRVVAELLTDHRQLWLAFAAGHDGPVACWTTEIKIDDGIRWVCVSALAGSHMRLWVREMAERMVEWAAEERCVCVRWAGKAGWARAVPDARVVGSVDGQKLFERAAA